MVLYGKKFLKMFLQILQINIGDGDLWEAHFIHMYKRV